MPGARGCAALSALRIAVDAHDLARDDRGIGRFLRAVLRLLAARDDVALTLVVREPLAFRHARAFAALLGVPQVRLRSRVPPDAEVVWHPWNGTFLATGRPEVATIHDLAPFAFPDADPKRRAHEQEPFLRTFARARRIIADSAFTQDELQRLAGVDPARVEVVPLGVDAAFAPGDTAALPPALRGRRFVLHVGAHDPRKNTATLIAAFGRAFPAGDVTLVTTRPPAAPAPHVEVFAGLSEAGLVALYRAAAAVAVPSLYEGFGLPLLEAMACGAPVVASRAASLPEVGGDVPRWVEAPTDVTAWSEALREVVAGDAARARMHERGIARAARFRWERCAEATLDVLRRVAPAE